MKILRITIVFFALGIFATSTNAQTERPKIGSLLPLSGDFSSLGDDNLKGADLAINQYEESKIFEKILGDTKAESKVAISEFRKMLSYDKIIGAYVMRSPMGMAINPISKEMKIPIFGGVGHSEFPKNNNYAWQFWSSSDEEGEFIADSIVKQGYRKVAILTAEDEWTLSVTEGLKNKLLSKELAEKVEIVYDKTVIPNEFDFKTLVSNIKIKNADAVFVNLSISQLGVCFKQLRSMKFSNAIFSNFWVQKKEVLDSAGTAVESVIFAEMKTDYPKFTEAFMNNYKKRPTAAALSSYVSFSFILQVLKKSKEEINTGEEFQVLLLKEKEITLPDHNFRIENRRVKFPLVLQTIKDSKVSLFSNN